MPPNITIKSDTLRLTTLGAEFHVGHLGGVSFMLIVIMLNVTTLSNALYLIKLFFRIHHFQPSSIFVMTAGIYPSGAY